MPTLRESITPMLAIIAASAIVMLLLAPLDATEWAAGLRAGFAAEASEGFEGGDIGGVFRIVGPLLKITLLMGIPGLITIGVRRMIGRASTG